MSETVLFRDVVVSAIGGGWGSDESIGNDARVAVIRGTDFESVAFGNTANVPIRYEKISKLASRTLVDGDLLLEISGGSSAKGQPTGRSLLVRSQWLEPLGVPVIPASFCRLVRIDRSRVLPQYAYYALQDMHRSGRAFEYENRSTGISNFQFQHFLDAERLFLPSFADQKAVANTLGALDDKIALNRRLSETLEAIAQALFQSWFVDFDPVRAKANGEASDAICKRLGLTAELLALFPDRLVDSEIGEIPKGWAIESLAELSSYLSRGISPKYIPSGGVQVLNQKCVRDGRIDGSKARRHDPSQRSVEGRFVKVGDILVNSTGVGTLGRTAQVLAVQEQTIVDSHITIVRPDIQKTSWIYAGIAMRKRETEIEGLSEGSTGQTELSRVRLGSMLFLSPPKELLQHFDRLVLPLRMQTARHDEQSFALSAVRDAILPKLLRGDRLNSNEGDA